MTANHAVVQAMQALADLRTTVSALPCVDAALQCSQQEQVMEALVQESSDRAVQLESQLFAI